MMEEVVSRHVEAIHYLASDANPGFWPVVLETFSEMKLKKGEVDRAERHVREVAGWSDLVEEKTGFVEVACQNED